MKPLSAPDTTLEHIKARMLGIKIDNAFDCSICAHQHKERNCPAGKDPAMLWGDAFPDTCKYFKLNLHARGVDR